MLILNAETVYTAPLLLLANETSRMHQYDGSKTSADWPIQG